MGTIWGALLGNLGWGVLPPIHPSRSEFLNLGRDKEKAKKKGHGDVTLVASFLFCRFCFTRASRHVAMPMSRFGSMGLCRDWRQELHWERPALVIYQDLGVDFLPAYLGTYYLW